MVAQTDIEENDGDKIKLIGAAALGLLAYLRFTISQINRC